MFVHQLPFLSQLSAVPPADRSCDTPQRCSFHSAETKCSTKRWDLKRVSGERHDNFCFLSVSFIRDPRNYIVRGRNVDLMLSRNWKAEGGKNLVRPLSGKDLQKPDCKLTGFVTLHLCLCLFVPASLPIVSQKLLLKEVFLYWGDNKLLIVLQALQSFTEHNFPICVCTVPGIVPFLCLTSDVSRSSGGQVYTRWMRASSSYYFPLFLAWMHYAWLI